MSTQVEPVERIMTALLEPLYEEQARRRGQKFSRRSGVPGIYPLGEMEMSSELGTLTMAELAEAHNNPSHPFNEIVDAECSKKCGAKFKCMRLFAAMNMVACDDCREKWFKAQRMETAKTYWEAICPPSFRETDKAHAGFPKAQYEATGTFSGTESLLLYGPSRVGKTRLAMLLLKRCLVKFNLHVGVMWPEQLKAVKKSFDTLEQIQKWGRYDVLLMDDALLTGAADDRIVDFLKDLLDYRMRYKRHQIITSQVGAADYKEQSEKWGDKITKADEKRIDALLGRVRETCKVVSFAETKPKKDEIDF